MVVCASQVQLSTTVATGVEVRLLEGLFPSFFVSADPKIVGSPLQD